MPFTFKVGAKIKEAWVLYKEHFGAMILIILVSGVLQAISQNISKQDGYFPVTLLLLVASILVSYVWIKSIMNLLDGKGFRPFSGESLPSFSQFWDFLKTNILISLCVVPLFAIIGLIILFTVISSYFVSAISSIVIIIAAVATVLLIVPALYLMGRLFPAVYLSVEKSQGSRKNISEAWGMTRGNAWIILGKSILIGLFIILGFMAFFVGAIITYPIGMIVLVMMYRELVKFKNTPISPIMVDIPEIPKAEIKVEIKAEEKTKEEQEVKEESIK